MNKDDGKNSFRIEKNGAGSIVTDEWLNQPSQP